MKREMRKFQRDMQKAIQEELKPMGSLRQRIDETKQRMMDEDAKQQERPKERGDAPYG
jgi:hypothetical protein